MGRTLPIECPHGNVIDWGDFGPCQGHCEDHPGKECPDLPDCEECHAPYKEMAKQDLHTKVNAMINEFGLAAVYNEVRSREGFCDNCGTPTRPGRIHQPQGFGWCEVSVHG